MNSLLIKKIEDNLARKNTEFQYNGLNKKTGTKYDSDGFNMYGFSGSNRQDIDVSFEGYTSRGFDKDGINVETQKPWDKYGFDFFGINIYTNTFVDLNNLSVRENQMNEDLDEDQRVNKSDIHSENFKTMFVKSVEEFVSLKESNKIISINQNNNIEYIDSKDNFKSKKNKKKKTEDNQKQKIIEINNKKKETDARLISQYAEILQNKIRYLKPEEMDIEKEIYDLTDEIDKSSTRNDRQSRISRIFLKAEKLASMQCQDAILVGNLDAYREIKGQVENNKNLKVGEN